MEKTKMLSMAGLRQRGWTPTMITTLLGEPDAIKKNPHYAKAAPMRCYSELRVVAVEQSPEFAQEKDKSTVRCSGARKAVETKRAALLRQVQEMKVSVEAMPVSRVRVRAIQSYNDWNGDAVTPDADRDFLERITVNFIRHNLTTYDKALEEVAGRIGVNDAVMEIRRKVFDAIADKYPCFSNECARQMTRRIG